MDLMNRGLRPTSQPNTHQEPSEQHSAPSEKPPKKSRLGKLKISNFNNFSYIALLFSVTVVLIGLLVSLVLFNNKSSESKLVNEDQYQAVFLNSGQVYFGHITDLNKTYLTLNQIYYLRVNQQVQPDRNQSAQNDISLVKLGCELHGPVDSMVINRDQVSFWENLKTDGQVSKAIADYVKANPDGQKCQTNTSSNNNTSGNSSSTNNNSSSSSSNSTNNTNSTSGTTNESTNSSNSTGTTSTGTNQ